MIAKSSMRGGGIQLADHLVKTDENEVVRIVGGRGVAANDPHGAIAEMRGQSAAWTGKKYLDHAHISPDRTMTDEEWQIAWNEYEKEFGLASAPYIEVAHSKANRHEHRHRAYLRVDAETNRLFSGHSDSNSKRRDEKVSRILEVKFGHKIIHGKHDVAVIRQLEREGLSDVAARVAEGSEQVRGNAKSWNEHQIAKRTGVERSVLIQEVSEAWKQADSGRATITALEQSGYVVARGDRRDVVFIDRGGAAHSPARLLTAGGIGTKAKDIRARFADIDISKLPNVERAQEIVRSRSGAIAQQQAESRAPDREIAATWKAERAKGVAQRREDARRQWIAERKAEYKAASEALWKEYSAVKERHRGDATFNRENAWTGEEFARRHEKEDLALKLAGQRRTIRAVTPPGLKALVLKAHKQFVAERRWRQLREEQAARWNEVKRVLADTAQPPRWRDYVAGRAVVGDPRAQLVAQSWRRSKQVDQGLGKTAAAEASGRDRNLIAEYKEMMNKRPSATRQALDQAAKAVAEELRATMEPIALQISADPALMVEARNAGIAQSVERFAASAKKAGAGVDWPSVGEPPAGGDGQNPVREFAELQKALPSAARQASDPSAKDQAGVIRAELDRLAGLIVKSPKWMREAKEVGVQDAVKRRALKAEQAAAVKHGRRR